MYDPEKDLIFVEELRRLLEPGVPLQIEEIDCNLEDKPFARALVEAFEELVQGGGTKIEPR